MKQSSEARKVLKWHTAQWPTESAILANALTGSVTGHDLDRWLASLINTPNTTAYDRAIDSAYLHTGVGGSQLHHLVDGQHDLVGAFHAAQQGVPDGSESAALLGTAHHLSKDLFSVMGLPVVSFRPEDYAQASDWIRDHLGISKAWQADLLQVNGVELLGGGLAVAALLLGLHQSDTHRLAELAGGSGLAGMLAANPIAMLAAGIALVLAWKLRRQNECWSPVARRLAVGGTAAGASIAVGGMLGGVAAAGVVPLILSMIVTIAAGISVRRYLLKRYCANEGVVLPDGVGTELSSGVAQVRRSILAYHGNIREELTKAAADIFAHVQLVPAKDGEYA